MFSYEKLRVYGVAKDFNRWRGDVLAKPIRSVAAINHLERASESIALNIAHASNAWGQKERINYIGHANGSALECAAALDVLTVKALLNFDVAHSGKQTLSSIVGMLLTWKSSTQDRVFEDKAEYRVRRDEYLFNHERLEVYKLALQLTTWIDQLVGIADCSDDLIRKVDKSTTSIVLNIAEGNGRFSARDQLKFINTAYKATTQSSALLDLALVNNIEDKNLCGEGQSKLNQIARMLTGWAKSMA